MPDEDLIPAEPAVEAPAPEAAAAAEAAAAEPAAPAESVAPAAPVTTPAIPDLSPAACAARLAELFPALFGPGTPKPLKLRIQADIQQRAPGTFNRKSLSGFLHRYTTTTAYLIALTKLPTRFDLDGAAAGDINAEHRDAATAELTRRRGVHDARRAAENAARREADVAARQQHAAEADARRDRAALLRAFETTTLTPANFCALKGLVEADLEAALTLARQERAQRPPEVQQDRRPPHGRGERGGPGFERKGRPRPPARPASR